MMAAMANISQVHVDNDEPMSRHTSWRVGGPADVFIRPRDAESLAGFLADLADDIPILVVGYGSNLLVRDGGFRGVVISMSRFEREISHLGNGRVVAGAGASCARLARECARWQLGPATFFAGIPGTVGGALAMNAGAYGGETWNNVVGVRTIDRAGALHERAASEFTIGYRHVAGPGDEWFVGATFDFVADSTSDKDSIRTLLSARSEQQPLGLASCGSVFRNPPGDYSARLIEAAGLKGHRIGGAVVSEKHANFIINEGAATAADIEALITYVQSEVERYAGVSLQAEVRIVGESLQGEANART